ncbi:phosphoesterase PA-phosphatase related [Desulfofarcimen acetoxidans DSM 771]|uniref:Phosphoesterase PA-phosphatase related n=1 Tax=Desulfofarcimen acetoxidans (strain ATCC 49208 / DSM 771 / KCTC 5769 / VKM B-1644 / 5575) TaxID=485916 RepID=C8W2D0_DESAS|nr:vanadium-dependent haloperoxidase [Desulfofarcimen acetoxidans]ACV63614.1 phosphoesterase PA-phosphatase related [Desulfofarcimen acetoxidans DSM 771]
MSGQGSSPNELNLNLGESCDIGPAGARKRRQEAFQVRQDATLFQRNLPLPGHPCNGDEFLYPNKIGNYSKALPHNQLGEVNLNAYQAMIEALTTGNPEDFESIPLGGVTKLTNPQAAYAFELAGPDSHHLSLIAPPAFSSAQIASEMAELYWQALTRDVYFMDYNTNPLTIAAASDLSGFADFPGPKLNGEVTTGTLFRGNMPGDLVGPYISQFLWQDIPFGAAKFAQRQRTTIVGDDHLTMYEEWLNIQNGFAPAAQNQFDPVLRYIRSGRDLGEWVHRDFSCQGVLTACLILLGYGKDALAQTNPYLRSATQLGFTTFGIPHILDFVARAARVALEAAWFQKFLVHRQLRPEEYGGRVQNLLTGASDYPINSQLFNSQAVSEIFNKYGTYLLPQAFVEGCPTHPSYPSGHAVYTGAGVTMLKAFFNESFVIPNPVLASADGLSLLPYSGPPLAVGGELNKLAANIAIGRNFAGIHWRSDASEGIKLGEAVAIRILEDYRDTYNEDFSGFSFTKFDGTTIII